MDPNPSPHPPPVPLILILVLTLGAAASCTTTGLGFGDTGAEDRARVETALAAALSLEGQQSEARVEVAGRTFVLDCVGLVCAAWWAAGVDLQKDFSRYRGNGVNRLYQSFLSWGALHWQPTPAPGDLIFWDHTWDTGTDPLYAEGHTHVGLVLSVASDGTVTYLHESASRGIVKAYLNLFTPEASVTKAGRVVNSPMFLGSSLGGRSNPPRWTSAQLWSAFGDGASASRTARRAP